MGKIQWYKLLEQEIARIDTAKTAKRFEKIIEGYVFEDSVYALIQGKKFLIFNSNDYLGLRFNPLLKKAEEDAVAKYGTGPGAVRFISGTTKVYKDLEQSIAEFHNKEDAMVFSSAFAANMAVIFCLLKGQSKDSVVDSNILVISDALNHRSIIDGIRIANLPKEQKAIYKHLDYANLENILIENKGKYGRVLVITDGVFSMIGEVADIKKLQDITSKYDSDYQEGILLLVDDSHGVGAIGEKGRGAEELSNGQADVLVGTFGKGFGADGGYVVGSKVLIDYFRESAATYIYSNSVSPGTAAVALQAVNLIDQPEGKKIMQKLKQNIDLFKKEAAAAGIKFSADSIHPIQPVLIGNPMKTKELTAKLFEAGILATPINYPVVPQGLDEIRVQISAAHTADDIKYFVGTLSSLL